jgi:pSer/pThr/pTyr-binding forkhead associated (FHA) protein
MKNETRPLEDSLIFNQNSRYILSLLNEEITSISWFLTNGVHKIGRLPDKEIILDDVTVSRNHGFITLEDDDIYIIDEDSTNGIFVNGELITEIEIKSGDRLQIGKFSLILTKTE